MCVMHCNIVLSSTRCRSEYTIDRNSVSWWVTCVTCHAYVRHFTRANTARQPGSPDVRRSTAEKKVAYRRQQPNRIEINKNEAWSEMVSHVFIVHARTPYRRLDMNGIPLGALALPHIASHCHSHRCVRAGPSVSREWSGCVAFVWLCARH